MRAVALIVLLATCVLARRPKWNELDGYNFEQYSRDFGRNYVRGTDEYKLRSGIFAEKLAAIRAHNADPTATWRRGVNMFTDMTAEEWKQYNKAFKSPHRPAPAQVYDVPPSNPNFPISVDYRTWTSPRVLSDVKHQGSCGSCWAFSATETLEAYYSLLTGMTPVLSSQQITSCTPMCNGCGGGDPAIAYMYINSTYHGITEEWAYPYANFFFNYRDPNSTTAACQNVTAMYPNKHRPYSWFADLNRVGTSGYGQVQTNSARATMSALATTGPLSILVAAGNWQDYETGVFKNTNASGASNEWGIDHAVQMVGYGHDADSGLNYWIVRNSWSTLWGEAGYIKLHRPAVEQCSPAEFGPVCGTSGCLYDPTYPFVTKNTPTPF